MVVAVGLLAPRASAEPVPDDWSEPAPLAPQSLLLDAVMSGERVVTVGERGHILVSSDEGANWQQALVPTRSILTAVTVAGDGHLWAVGHDAVIVHSNDGGVTWTRRHFDPDANAPLLDVWFENEQHGLAIGAYGLFLETRDGGNTWSRQEFDEEESHWNAIAQSADGTLFVAAEFGAVFRSVDKGRSWDCLTTPYEGSFFGALGLADGGVLVFGLRGNVYRTDDDGETWNAIPTGTTASLTHGLQRADGTVILVGLSGTVLIGADNAGRFTQVARADRRGISAFVEVNPRCFLMFGEGGVRRCEDVRRHLVRQGKKESGEL